MNTALDERCQLELGAMVPSRMRLQTATPKRFHAASFAVFGGNDTAKAESASNQNSLAAARVAIFLQHMLALVHQCAQTTRPLGGG